MLVRCREESDLDACQALALTVRELDGYPPHAPGELRRFIASPDALGAWVAEVDGKVAGHIALHRSSSPEVMALAAEVVGDAVGVVARLFVDPNRRRRGVAATLLLTATAEARRRRLRVVLDVATHFDAAVALYEKHGWMRAGEVTVSFRGVELREYVYLLPAGT